MKRNSRKNRLKHFVHDGVWASVCDGFAESNFNAFAGALSASAGQLGWLSSLQNLFGCWLQLWGEKMVAALGSRKRFVLTCVSLQILLLGTMLASARHGIGALPFMGLILLFSSVGSVSGPAWNSWVSELLPAKRRGFCFGIRNQRTYPAQFVAMMSAGFLLQWIGGYQGTQLAFCFVFAIGLVAKLLSLRHLCFQPDPGTPMPRNTLGPIALLRSGWDDPQLKKIVLFFAAMGFAVNLSGPFQSAYMLQTLHLGYFSFAMVNATVVIGRLVSAPLIGRIVDRTGYLKPLILAVLFMPCSPLGWSLAKGVGGLIVTQLIVGVVWTTFDLAVFSFVVDNSSPEERQRAFSLRQISYNLASAAGAFTSGLLVSYYKVTVVAFWASIVGRTAAAIFVLYLLGQLRVRYRVSMVLQRSRAA